MTQAELEALCLEWQKRLRLQDWQITVSFARYNQMPDKDCAGNCSYHTYKREARIRITAEQDRGGPGEYWDPIEQTLIHELLHLHFADFWDASKEAQMEQAINLIACALYHQKYQIRKDHPCFTPPQQNL